MLLTKARTAVCAAAVLGVLGSAGCSPAPEPSERYLDPDLRSEVLARVQALNFPFDSDPAYAVRIANLQTRLINECVSRHGVVPPRTQELPYTTEVLTPSEPRLWLLPEEDYGVASALSDPEVLAALLRAPSADVPPDGMPPDPEAYDRAVYGPDDERISFPIPGGGTASVPVGGCFGEATEAMYGVPAADYERTYYAIPNIRDVMTDVLADERVRRSVGAWASCMGEQGVRASGPADLYEAMSRWVEGVVEGSVRVAHVEELEHELARHDRACRTESGLGTEVAEVFLESARAALEGSEGVVLEYRAMIEHAQSVLGSG